jgi:hypothetical protein
MTTLSSNVKQNATKKQKTHRDRPVIARKVIAFQELINLKQSKKSEREAANILEVPNSTMQSWRTQEAALEANPELVKFFSEPSGAVLLQRIVMASYQTTHFGCGGIRAVQEFLRLSELDKFVAASEGALHAFFARCEEHIVLFGKSQELKLAGKMAQRKITAGLDEMYRGQHPCLVAIEVVSGFILLEKFTDDRTAATWSKELTPRLSDLNVKLDQVVSDLCGGIRSYAKEAGAKHIPELFHAQYEISKATAAPLAAQEKELEKALMEADKKLKKTEKKHGEGSEKACEARIASNYTKIGLEKRQERKCKVQTSRKALGKIHHPIDLATGKIQTAEVVRSRIDTELKVIEQAVKEAELSKVCEKRIGKARRAFDAIIEYVFSFFILYAAFVSDLKLQQDQECFFNEVVFPLSYLRMIWRRLPRKERSELKPLRESLEKRLKEAPYQEELKKQWLNAGQECAERFQRSSSCVEGRNGLLSLYHHRFHRLNTRSLKALTIVHNFHTKRSDGSTAAERFFRCKHESLFESLVTNVKIPGQPQNQYHDQEKRLIGWKKRLTA